MEYPVRPSGTAVHAPSPHILHPSPYDSDSTNPFNAYDISTSPLTGGTVGPGFRFCWGHSPSGASSYRTELGLFTLNGPLAADYACPMSIHCYITLDGTGLASTNKILITNFFTQCDAPSVMFGASGYTVATTAPPALVAGGTDYQSSQISVSNGTVFNKE